MKNTKDGNLHTNVSGFNSINLMSLSTKLLQLYMFNSDNKIAVNNYFLQYNKLFSFMCITRGSMCRVPHSNLLVILVYWLGWLVEGRAGGELDAHPGHLRNDNLHPLYWRR